MIQSLYRRLLIPAFETGWHRRSTFRRLHELEASQWLSQQEHEQRQLAALRNVLAHAYAHSPYYRQAWQESGLEPHRVQSLADFTAWPVIERETIHEHRPKMRAQIPGLKLIRKSTGGSSGVPLQFDLDTASNDAKMAAWHRGYGWAGAGLGTKQFYLWGGANGARPLLKRWKDAVFHGLYRRKIVNSFRMSDEHVGWYFDQLQRHRPDAIVAYVNPLYEFARLLEERGLRPFQPATIVVGAEKLHDFQRETIERVFGTHVFETYGSREFTLIGGECSEHNGLHLTMENLVVEILDDDDQPTPQGQEGNLVITDLTNYGMPFIRYRNGDRAVAGWKQCRCGRGLPLLTEVVGRQLDMLSTPDGRMVPGEFFPHTLKDVTAIRRFQVTQQAEDEIVLRVELRARWDAADRQRIEQECRDVVGSSVRFSIEEVSEIPLTALGKQRVVVNLVAGRKSPASDAVCG